MSVENDAEMKRHMEIFSVSGSDYGWIRVLTISPCNQIANLLRFRRTDILKQGFFRG